MAFADALVQRAFAEWEWFGRDLGRGDKFVAPGGTTTTDGGTAAHPHPRKETVEPYASRIADYWLVQPATEYDRLAKAYGAHLGRLDGTIDIAWSAVFVSYCMQMAGAGRNFPYAAGHSVWIAKSIANRLAGRESAALVGWRPGEVELRVGDLIGRPRGGDASRVTYDNAPRAGWFTSHSDIVVEVDRAARRAFVIGGNVGQSVSKCEVELDAAGGLADPGGWIVQIRNNIPSPDLAAVASAEPARVG
ncbi:MAG: DUF2272 domain-containing protein [Hyphomicrobiales bacterium]|nr:DUF2272 domain-containing protein [Hyphomicrobiales bacterium]